MKSIMHCKRSHTCYLCIRLHGDSSWKDNLEEHHAIFGTANRKLSEKYGLKVYLCKYHHTGSSNSVHRNNVIARMVQKNAQMAFEIKFPDKNFMEIFGKNYLTDDTYLVPPKKEENGFMFLKGEEDE